VTVCLNSSTVFATSHIVFPEIDYDKVETMRGMDIVVQTSAKTDEEAKVLLAELGFPFPKDK